MINPGGPGGSGVQYAQGARNEFPAALRARFDIVGFDPRGVAGSEPALTCMSGRQLDTFLAIDDMPANTAQLNQIVSASKQYAARCAQNSGSLLPYVGTENAARDMDVLRAALGQAKLTYLGKSYGTYLGAWYAQLFPQRVRALVLDGAFDPDTPALQDDLVQAQGFQVALKAFLTSCLASTDCPLGAQGSSVQAAEGRLKALVVRSNSRPLASHLGTGQVADGAMLLNGVASALYSRSFWPDLKIGLADAVHGDGSVLLQLADLLVERNPNGTYANLVDADTAISCLDRPFPRSLAAWQAAARQAAQAAPLFGAPIVWGNLACAYWPVKSYPLPDHPGRGRAADPGRGDAARPGHAVPVGAGADQGPVLRRAARLERRRAHRLRRGQLVRGHDRERLLRQPQGAAQRHGLFLLTPGAAEPGHQRGQAERPGQRQHDHGGQLVAPGELERVRADQQHHRGQRDQRARPGEPVAASPVAARRRRPLSAPSTPSARKTAYSGPGVKPPPSW